MVVVHVPTLWLHVVGAVPTRIIQEVCNITLEWGFECVHCVVALVCVRTCLNTAHPHNDCPPMGSLTGVNLMYCNTLSRMSDATTLVLPTAGCVTCIDRCVYSKVRACCPRTAYHMFDHHIARIRQLHVCPVLLHHQGRHTLRAC